MVEVVVIAVVSTVIVVAALALVIVVLVVVVVVLLEIHLKIESITTFQVTYSFLGSTKDLKALTLELLLLLLPWFVGIFKLLLKPQD